MGRFQIDNSVVGKALSIGAGDDTIDSRSAWLFENQSGKQAKIIGQYIGS